MSITSMECLFQEPFIYGMKDVYMYVYRCLKYIGSVHFLNNNFC